VALPWLDAAPLPPPPPARPTKEEQTAARFAAWEAVKDKGEVWWNPPPQLGT